MSIGALLNEFVTDAQAKIAANWCDQCAKILNKEISFQTASSRFSECLNDKVKGVKFFFNDSQHAQILFEILNVPEEKREPIRRTARQIIESGGQSKPRIVIDLVMSSTLTAEHHRWLENLLQNYKETQPLALFARNDHSIPLSLAKNSKLNIELIEDQTNYTHKVKEKISSDTLLLSPHHDLAPWEQWAAIGIDQLDIYPKDAISQFEKNGQLSALPTVEYPLNDIVPANSIGSDLALTTLKQFKQNPPLLKKTMEELTNEEGIQKIKGLFLSHYPPFKWNPNPADRFALANLLNISATSTQTERQTHAEEIRKQQEALERENIENEITNLLSNFQNMECKTLTSKEHDARLARAVKRDLGSLLWRVGDHIHGLNLKEESFNNLRFTHHQIACAPNEMSQLVAYTENWTEDDLLADSLLEDAICQLDPTKKNQHTFDHARWTLLSFFNHHPLKKSSLSVDWKSVLNETFSKSPPASELKISQFLVLYSQYRDHKYGFCFVEKNRIKLNSEFFYNYQDFMIIKRNMDICITTNYAKSKNRNINKDPAAWQDLYEKNQINIDSIEIQPYAEKRKLNLFPKFWNELDLITVSIWMSMRSSLQQLNCVEMHDGTIALHFGQGITAKLSIRKKAAITQLRALLGVTDDLKLTKSKDENYILSINDILRTCHTHSAQTDDYLTQYGPVLPSEITILDGNYIIEIQFSASALLGTPSFHNFGPINGIVSAIEDRRKQEEERQRQIDDDDD